MAASQGHDKPTGYAGYWYALVSLGLLLVFLSEVLSPLGFAHGTLYSPLVLLAALTRERLFVLGTAVGAAILTVLGIFISPEGAPGAIYLTNRFVSILSLGIIASVALFALRTFNRGQYIRKQLTQSLDDLQQQQFLLNMAGQIGHIGGWLAKLPMEDAEHAEVMWSDEVCRIHAVPPGYSPSVEEAISFYTPECRTILEEAFKACVEQGRHYDLELQIVNTAGTRVWVRTIGQAIKDQSGRVCEVHGAFQDLSQEKQAQLVLQESRQRFHQLADAMPLIVFTTTARGQLDYVNRSLTEYTGLSDRELLGDDSWLNSLHPVDRRICLQRWWQSLENGTPLQVEFRLRNANGDYRWHMARLVPICDQFGNIAQWYGTATDIDEMKNLQDLTRRSEERFRYLAMATTDAVWDWDVIKRKLWWNDGYYRLFNFESEDISATPEFWSSRIHPDDKEDVVNSLRDTIKGTGTEWHRQYRFLRNDGSVAHVDDHGYVIRDASGTGLRMVGGMSDITAEKSLQEQLQQSERLRSVGELTGGVAHDFNNLLTVIIGNTELLDEQLSDSPKLQGLVDVTRTAAERGSRLTQRLLAFARRQPLEPRTVNLRQLLENSDPLLRRTLPANIDIEMVHAAGLWHTHVDPGQLENCILNLCVNARDAMPDGGKVTLETRNAWMDRDYCDQHDDITPGQYVMLAISDTGTGIDPGVIQNIFDPFFTTKGKQQGTGLGLSMVYGFVKQSRGHIKVYSEIGQGTTVRVYLPRSEKAAAEEENMTPRTVTTATATGTETILVVEDDTPVRETVCRQLAELGYTILEAEDAEAALKCLRKHADIDLLFTDVILPGNMNGRQLADQVRERRQDIKVLYTSGYTENAIVHHGRLDQGVELLSKPYRRAELTRRLREVLDADQETEKS